MTGGQVAGRGVGQWVTASLESKLALHDWLTSWSASNLEP